MSNKGFWKRVVSVVLIVMVVQVYGPLFDLQGAAFADEKDHVEQGITDGQGDHARQGAPAGQEDHVEHATGGMDETAPAPDFDESDRSKLKLQGSMPDKYDSREEGNVTPVRDQDALNICWSYGTIAAIESSLLAHGQVSSPDKLDLSERQLAYFSLNYTPEAMGNTKGDATLPIRASNYIDNYGNAWITTETMASGIGVANEKDVPTTSDLIDQWWQAKYKWTKNFGSATNLSTKLARGANTWRMSSARRIPVKDTVTMKKAIMDNGGVAVLTYLEDPYYDEKILYNEWQSAYYNPYCKESNHLVTIVGWDDSYDRMKFTEYDEDWDDEEDYARYEKQAPKHNGAWLVKNSYGKWWGDDGYYWMSYDDCYFNNAEDVSAYAYEMKPASRNEILYQYDGSASDAFIKIPSGGSVSNMFQVRGASGKNEILKSVSLSLMYDSNVNYSVQVYTDCTAPADPTSGTPALSSPKTGTVTSPGIYTIDLNRDVPLTADSTFAVVVTLSHSNGTAVKYDVDASYKVGGFLQFKSAVSAKQSFKKTSSSAAWKDLYNEIYVPEDDDSEPWSKTGCAARIKAMTIAEGADSDPALTSISGAKMKLSKKTMTYSGKGLKSGATVTLDGKKLTSGKDYVLSYENNISVGKANAVITGIGKYKGAKRASYKINPKSTSLSKLTAGKKKMTVKWKKLTKGMAFFKVTGYQVQYGTKSSFKGAKKVTVKGSSKSKRVIKKLKSRKKYYVRIRSYMKEGKTTYYSAWSKKKSVRVK